MASSDPSNAQGNRQPQPVPLAPRADAPPVPPQPVPPNPVPAQPVAAARTAPSAPVPAQPVPAQPRSTSAAGRPVPVPVGQSAMPVDKGEELEGDAGGFVQSAPPWLISGIVHMLLLIVLGIWVLHDAGDPSIFLQATVSDTKGEQIDEKDFEVKIDEPVELQEQIITPDKLPPVDDPFAAPPNVEISPLAVNTSSTISAPSIGLALKGREEGMRKALLSAYDGSPQTENAVLEGLRWLARNQRNDGSWSLTGPYSLGAHSENREAATAMALLAFQGQGHTHKGSNKAKFRVNVSRGWKYLLKRQDANGNFFHQGQFNHTLYTQAQCTIALCELYGMTQDPELKKPAQLALAYCVKAQDKRGGGWRYEPGNSSDMSVTGWFVMAMQSAKMAGLEVPTESLNGINKFLNSAQSNGGRSYGYQAGTPPLLSMTAEGLLCRQYMGWGHDDPRLVDGADYLTSNLINWVDRNAYYWYYATQVCHHMEGKHWKAWNEAMKKHLPAKQEGRGREQGSWNPDGDQWGASAGRLFVTCLHIYMLEVYYRHLPIYQHKAISKKSL